MSNNEPRRKQTARRSRPFQWPARTSTRGARPAHQDRAADARPTSARTASPPPDRAPDDSSTADADALALARMPPLAPPRGPPLAVHAHIGSIIAAAAADPTRDPRLAAVSQGFAVSVHPLRPPNARAAWCTASAASVVDARFVRFAGLLHRVVPLRAGVDVVVLDSLSGRAPMAVAGRVEVVFDAHGYEFSVLCWVADVGRPLDIVLGNDWAGRYAVEASFKAVWDVEIISADAKRVRDLEDVYVTQ